jgi:hypothetical protein
MIYNIMPAKKKIKKRPIVCFRCDQVFTSWNAIRAHSKSHLKTLQELKQLQEGKIPDETKLGLGFKGKNKIIIS